MKKKTINSKFVTGKDNFEVCLSVQKRGFFRDETNLHSNSGQADDDDRVDGEAWWMTSSSLLMLPASRNCGA